MTTVDRPLAEKFLRALYEGVPEDQWLTLFSIDRRTARPNTRWHQVGDISALAADAESLGEWADVWFGVATRKELLPTGRGGADACSYLPAIYCDIDVRGPNHKSANLPPSMDAAYELLAMFPEEPTFIVHTGGGMQPYWKFDSPVTVDEALERFLGRWAATWQDYAAQKGWGIDNVWDVARILRVPGTVNRKGLPQPVTVEGTL